MEANLLTNLRRFFIAVLICGFVALAGGCTTTYDEWAGKMANQKPAKSVKGDQQRREARDKKSDESVILPRAPFNKLTAGSIR